MVSRTRWKEGWVHRSFLSQSSGRATTISDYSARELTVSAGERGRVLGARWLGIG